MAHCDRSERGGGSHWKRRHHRRNVPDAFHNDMGPVFQQCNGSVDSGRARVGPRLQSVRRRDANTGPLDELTLKHMAQDCSSVKNQLLKLKSLLQMEDGGPEIEDSEEDNAARLQLEELTKEVRVLREELRDKDRTICQLTRQQQQLQQQVPGRCHCHQRAASFRGDLRTQHDKATQTPWRGQGHSHAPQTLQASSPSNHDHLTQERLVKTALTEDHSDPWRRRRPGGDGSHCTDSDPSTANPASAKYPALKPNQLSVLPSTSDWPRITLSPLQASAPALGDRSRPKGGQPTSGLGLYGPRCPRILQPPRLHMRVSIPALPPGSVNSYVLQTGSAAHLANLRTNQLPPPSRGLPCFNYVP